MVTSGIPLVREIDRVPSVTLPLDREQEARYQRLMDETVRRIGHGNEWHIW